MEFILYLALILLCTKVAGDISVRLGQPAVLGKLIVGILLGPAVLGWIEKDSFITQVSEIGVLLLMFIAGLETDIDQLRKNWKSAFAVAVGGIILPFIGGYGAAIAFGFSSNYALFFGVIFCATSVSISVQVLKEMNKLNSREGTTILGAAVVDDVLVVILLAFIMSIVGQGGDVSLGLLVGKKLLFFAITFVAGWLVVPRVMKWLAPLKVTEAVISAALIICFGFAYFAEWMQMAGIIGAFAAGIAVSLTPYKHDVEHKVEPIAYSIFVPVFFVSIGLNVSFDGIGSQLGLLAVITIIAIVTKMAGGWLGARVTGFDSRSSLAIGAGMISRGEVALIIAATGLQSGLLQPEYFTSIIIMVIITTLVTPPMLKMFFNKKDNAVPVEQKNSVNM
ncbi:cation:proton antiporter [Paenibacillus dendritiformis]|jgi:monovalent cation:proton antiporter-2 (CPA2) family protein|uniref:Transporter, monovalent cation:proton antiporter-2 (CPA2) family protein n=1 Tax=Paenibacillus dendritiformis C454 TaxID=1131935 RepID=H3SCR1_9BACL|nr:cation:proton antiporter [Paenibacillus dendritiformis]EHQ63164.1 transporter, monovalent cation:proton antiporter-2 (CPA2) family protein [Paenibacillus dendritiformis C454]PZM67624.1 cation:proton antiporter [Paenibacillus dendritiformis]CAH8771936.1 cation:proton antiporter [Paenibacillus dendritiformis]